MPEKSAAWLEAECLRRCRRLVLSRHLTSADAPEVRVFAKRATGCRPWHSGCTVPVPVEESADVGDE